MKEKISIEQSYWDDSYKEFAFYAAKDALTEWLDQNYFNKTKVENKTVFEIGCFPGRYLIHFGQKGMEVNGLDRTPYLNQLPQWLTKNHVRSNQFYEQDIFHFIPEKTYDLVCSFGFIEHFSNYREVIEKHIELNSHKGTIIITTPNFRGFHYYLHMLFDDTNLKRHNTEAMVPNVWATVLKKAGYAIECQGYFGKYDFWFDSDLSKSRMRLREKYMKTIHRSLRDTVDFESSFFSPYCGVIASR